jgi:hypothetical protein
MSTAGASSLLPNQAFASGNGNQAREKGRERQPLQSVHISTHNDPVLVANERFSRGTPIFLQHSRENLQKRLIVP